MALVDGGLDMEVIIPTISMRGRGDAVEDVVEPPP